MRSSAKRSPAQALHRHRLLRPRKRLCAHSLGLGIDAVSRSIRVVGIEIEQCVRCAGALKVIASIEEPELIERILAHRRERGEEAGPTTSHGERAPPQTSLF